MGTRENKFRFTDNRIQKLNNPFYNKRLYFYDTEQPKLALQLTSIGTKTFQLRYWDKTKARTVVMAIGKYPGLTIKQARKITANLLVDVSNGIDIIEREKSARDENTLDELFTRWLKNAKKHKTSWPDDIWRYDTHLKPTLGNKKLSWFTREKIRHWHSALTEKTRQRKGPDGKPVKLSPTTANRSLALLKTIFNQERPDKPNPCIGVKMFKETSRDRFLQPSELKSFFEALENETAPEILRDYILISLFTGARKSNILSMCWNEIDFDQMIWRIPSQKSKNGEVMTIPLVEEIIAILKERKSKTASVFVFPGNGKSGHYMEPRKAWVTLLRRANLQDVRLHDLRRTLGSYQTITGASSTIVGKTLGHKSPEATAVYARLNLDPVRDSMEKAVAAMKVAGELPSKVINLHNE